MINSEKKFFDLIIFTTTLYKNDEISNIRKILAMKFINNAKELGIKLVVVDGGSDDDFLEYLKKDKNIELHIEKGLEMGDSRRLALKIAKNIKYYQYFLWSEPEKHDLLRPDFLLKMINPLRMNIADIVVPNRVDMDSMPEFQSLIEDNANKESSLMIDNNKFDLWFGPKIFNNSIVEYFIDYRSISNRWDSIIVPVVWAYKDGKKILSVDIDYRYDILQKDSEYKNHEIEKKRIQQYDEVLREIKKFIINYKN